MFFHDLSGRTFHFRWLWKHIDGSKYNTNIRIISRFWRKAIFETQVCCKVNIIPWMRWNLLIASKKNTHKKKCISFFDLTCNFYEIFDLKLARSLNGDRTDMSTSDSWQCQRTRKLNRYFSGRAKSVIRINWLGSLLCSEQDISISEWIDRKRGTLSQFRIWAVVGVVAGGDKCIIILGMCWTRWFDIENEYKYDCVQFEWSARHCELQLKLIRNVLKDFFLQSKTLFSTALLLIFCFLLVVIWRYSLASVNRPIDDVICIGTLHLIRIT